MKWNKWLIAYAVVAAGIVVLFTYTIYVGGSMVPLSSNSSWTRQNGSSSAFHHK